MGAFVPGSVTVEDGLGQPVEVTINEGPTPGRAGTWAEIISKQPWEPRTTYRVQVRAMYPETHVGKDSFTFVAGTDRLQASELSVPKTRLSTLTGLPPQGSSCVAFTSKTCINVEGQTEDVWDVEVIARRGDQMLLRTLLWVNDSDFGFADQPDCVELRRRAPTGERSKPVTFCGEDLHAMRLEDASGDWSTWPQCKGGAFKQQSAMPDLSRPDAAPEDDSGADRREYGCAAVPGIASTHAPFAMLATIAAGAVVRRRRAAKRR